jgi:DNA-binding MarR family transcriptional regulator/N-acetylglutamate synthase-like GNAT family acetyltransferase
VTRRIGVLRPDFLGRAHSLTEARVLYELGRRPQTAVTELRGELGLDSGYLSRLLARLEAEGLIARRRSEADARRQLTELTPAGQREVAELDARAAEETAALLAELPEGDRRRLVGAMAAVREVLGDDTRSTGVVLRPMGIGDYGWVVARHGALYAEEYGWDEGMEALVARIVADHIESRDPRSDAGWIAELDGRPAGCVFCVRADETTAKLRLLLVEPEARGHGIGARLVEECLRFARRAGYSRMVLWTQSILTSAHKIYAAQGFRLVDEEPHHSFGVDLVGQTWEADL